jgi:hypothetical protein
MADLTTLARFDGTNGSMAGLSSATFGPGDLLGGSGFLAGTQIATPEGELPVDQLAIGHAVLTPGGDTSRIVRIDIAQLLTPPGRHGPATPVIVRKGALADNIPNRDLRVPTSLALFYDGTLIPVEFLINHRTILWDDDARDITIYHVELEAPDLLLANGAAAGNGPARPISGARLDAAWMRLLERAGGQCVVTTNDPDLYLRVDGRRVNATLHGDDWYRFGLAVRPAELRIVSRSGVPQELGVSRDPRRLGVAVRQIVALKGRMVRTIEADDPSLEQGFHALDAETGFRWTNGDAFVPVNLFDRVIGPLEIFLRLSGSATYAADLRTRRVPAGTGSATAKKAVASPA